MTSNTPSWRDTLEKNVPDMLKQISTLQESLMKDGALSTKTKTLMMMLCDSLLAHPDGVTNLARRARALGASEDEVAETLAVAFIMGGLPALVTGSNAFLD